MKPYYLLFVTAFATMSAMGQTPRTVDINTSAQKNIPKAQRVNTPYDVNALIGDKQPDVFLDIPNLSVDKITLDVDKLDAHVSLDARVANLVVLKAGVDASINQVKIAIEGVQAQALLVVRLDNVKEILMKTLETLDKNPKIVEGLLNTVDNTVNTVGGVANNALRPDGLISKTVNTLGQTVNKTLDLTGNIVETTLDATGKVLSSKTVGKLSDLTKTGDRKTVNDNTLTTYKDSDGNVIEVTTDKSGRIISRVIKTQNF